MDKDLKMIIDQLQNNENATDEELSWFLTKNTPWEKRELLHLIMNVRTEILNAPVSTTQEEFKNMILPYLD